MHRCMSACIYIHTFLLTLYSIYNVMHAHMYSVSNTFLELFAWDKLMDQITMIHTTESQVAVIVIGRVCLGLISPDSGDIEILQWPLLEPRTCMCMYVQLLIHGKGNANIFYMDINLSNRGYLCSEYIQYLFIPGKMCWYEWDISYLYCPLYFYLHIHCFLMESTLSKCHYWMLSLCMYCYTPDRTHCNTQSCMTYTE